MLCGYKIAHINLQVLRRMYAGCHIASHASYMHRQYEVPPQTRDQTAQALSDQVHLTHTSKCARQSQTDMLTKALISVYMSSKLCCAASNATCASMYCMIACNLHSERALLLDLSWNQLLAESHPKIQTPAVLALFCAHPTVSP